MVPSAFSARIVHDLSRFRIGETDDRIRALETQVEVGRRDIEKLELRLADLASYAAFKQQLTVLKRRVLRQPIDQ